MLINVVAVAVLSMPTPFRQFSPANLFVAEAPFIWLPAFLVTSAIFGTYSSSAASASRERSDRVVFG